MSEWNDIAAEYGLVFRTGWKCLDGAMYTLDEDDKTFTTLEAARAHAKTAAYNEGLGRRVFLTDAEGTIHRSVCRIRLGPDYKPRIGGGWGLY